MPKLRFNKDAIKGFFVSHVEKLVLAVVMVLFVVFVYSGYSLDGLPVERTPDHLKDQCERIIRQITADSWEEIAKDIERPTEHEQRAKDSQIATQRDAYVSRKPYMPPIKPSGIKRGDPEILPPYALEVDVVIGPMAVPLLENDIDLLAELDNTEPKKKRKKKKRKQRMTEDDFMASFGEGMEEETGDSSMMISGAGPDIAGSEDGVTSAADRYFPGFRPPDTDAMGKSRVVVAVKALVPFREQWDRFDQAFVDAMHYNPGRDRPNYLFFHAERAEVPNDPTQELVWEPASHTGFETERSRRWIGVGGEVADPRFMNEKLTMPIPPIMMRDGAEFALHSQVSRYLEDDPSVAYEEESVEQAVSLDDLLRNPGGPQINVSPEARTPAAGGLGGYGLDPMGGPMGPTSVVAHGPHVDYLMVRFFDIFEDQQVVGKKYRYRIKVLVEDVNHPMDARLSPPERALSEEVRQRLAAVANQESQGGDRISWLDSGWSEPSDPVTVQMPATTLTGPIGQTGQVRIANTPVSVPVVEPSANVLSIVYDFSLAADVPAYTDAYRGSVLDFSKSTDIIHPVTLEFKKLKDYAVQTNRLLVDFRGGELLPKLEEEEKTARKKKDDKDDKDEEEKEEEELYAASEYLFFDLDGNFFLKNDLDDLESYELYTIPEEVETEDP